MVRPRLRRHSYLAEPDLALRLVQTPLDIDPVGGSVLALRVRAQPYISSALLHLSGDGVSYHVAHDSLPPVVGMRLLNDLGEADGEPVVESQGPDIRTLRVLPDVDWRAGQYVLLVEDEWCYLREAVCISEGRYLLLGLLRGCMGTRAAAHPRGSQVFVADRRWLAPVKDHLFRPGVTVHAKTQPIASTVLPLTRATTARMTLPGGRDD